MKIRLGNAFYLYHSEGLGWFRFFGGCGIAWKDLRRHQLLFSERNGFTKTFSVFKLSFKILKNKNSI